MELTKGVRVESLAGGAVIEKLNYELEKVVENIMDINMDPNAVREITLKIKVKPNGDQSQGAVIIQTNSKLASLAPYPAHLFFTLDEDGKPSAVEAIMKEGDMFDVHGKITPMLVGGKV